MIYENLPKEYELELKNFLARKINYDMSILSLSSTKSALASSEYGNNPEESNHRDEASEADLKFWGGEKIIPSIVAWSRRMLLLDVL